MKKIITILLIMAILIPGIAYGNDYSRVKSMGLIGQGVDNWDRKISREEMATVATRLVGMEREASLYTGNLYKDVDGWAKPYINMANHLGLMKGTSQDTFNPKANIKYIELLTIIMRVLEYKDGIDFVAFPEDYYNKALEIGLANLYIEATEEITREIVAETLDKSLDLESKDTKLTLLTKISYTYTNIPIIDQETSQPSPKETGPITIEDMKFNTNISSLFSGRLKGRTDFTGYKVVLSSNNKSFSQELATNSKGEFSTNNFSIDILTKMAGYKYKIINKEGGLVDEGDLH